MTGLPVIDIVGLGGGSEETLVGVAREIEAASRLSGFFYIAGHGATQPFAFEGAAEYQAAQISGVTQFEGAADFNYGNADSDFNECDPNTADPVECPGPDCHPGNPPSHRRRVP